MYNVIIFPFLCILQGAHYQKFSFHPSPDSWSSLPISPSLLPFQTKRKQTRRYRVVVTRGEGIFSFIDAFLPSSFLLSTLTNRPRFASISLSDAHHTHRTHTHARVHNGRAQRQAHGPRGQLDLTHIPPPVLWHSSHDWTSPRGHFLVL